MTAMPSTNFAKIFHCHQLGTSRVFFECEIPQDLEFTDD